MGDEALKRNTDCVYFLASPLTCKKGIECEYRHSESARLNPRDCWYWLAGNCQNSVCAFRHPPLDSRPETSLEPVSLPQQASVPVSKTNVPCYFYYNGFCNRGESCAFMHGPNDATPAWKSSKTASTDTSVHPLEINAPTMDDRVPVPMEAPTNPSETTVEAVENVQLHSKINIKKSASTKVVKQRYSVQVSMPEHGEMLAKPEALLPAEDVIDGGSLSCGGQTPEEQADGHVEPEEWWESSPGFDVLVDDGSENLGYEENEEYLLAHEREASVIHHHLLQYDYEDSIRHDSIEYSDVKLTYEQEMELYGSVENEHVPDYGRRVSKPARETMQDSMMFQKRKLLPREVKHGNRDGVDLRDHLRKRRRSEGRMASNYPRRRGFSHSNDRSKEIPEQRHAMGSMPCGRLASEIGKNMIGLHSDNEICPNNGHRHDWHQHSHPRHIRSRLQEKERRRHARPRPLLSDTSRHMASREPAAPQDSTSFSGPKTLAQIKEERKKAMVKEDGFGNTTNNRNELQDFEGPKPLTEILREKGKLDSVHDNHSSRSKYDNV